ncbi:MAG: hypothetical protein AAFV87_00635 [Pseudomonadota bacterium]
MSAILNEIRRLDAAYARGEFDLSELERRKDALVETVPEVDDVMHARPSTDIGLGHILILCFSLVAFVTGIGLMLVADFDLALTLGIMVLAAITVGLFRALE